MFVRGYFEGKLATLERASDEDQAKLAAFESAHCQKKTKTTDSGLTEMEYLSFKVVEGTIGEEYDRSSANKIKNNPIE